jgi:GTPase SAR1 family protein
MSQFVKGNVPTPCDPHVGLEISPRVIEVEDKLIQIQIWNTSTEMKFKAFNESFYRGALGVLLFYDANDRLWVSSKPLGNEILHKEVAALTGTVRRYSQTQRRSRLLGYQRYHQGLSQQYPRIAV